MIIVYAIPFFLSLMAIEFWYSRRTKNANRGYETRDTLASLAMGIGSLIVKLPFLGAVYALNTLSYEYRFFDLPDAAWVWIALIVAEDFCFYCFHRIRHAVRFLWAEHIAHHSSQHYNLATALRQPWTAILTGPIFWAPMGLLGFTPEQVVLAHTVSLIYQYWIHTEFLGKLGPFEWIFNTPSHHRVHHGRNTLYLDRNHGGILIIWDRLFGTFQEELDSEPVDYGLTTNIDTFNVFKMVFGEFAATWRDAASASGLRNKLGYIFGPPGWSHDGSRKTSKQMRADKSAETASSSPQ